jgi:hypothetical protein
MVATVLPLNSGLRQASAKPLTASAAVFVHYAPVVDEGLVTTLGAAFRLTGAEARVLAGLLEGLQISEIAHRYGGVRQHGSHPGAEAVREDQHQAAVRSGACGLKHAASDPPGRRNRRPPRHALPLRSACAARVWLEFLSAQQSGRRAACSGSKVLPPPQPACLLPAPSWMISTRTPCGARTKALRLPVAVADGFWMRSQPFASSSATTVSMSSTVRPICSMPK